MSQEDDMNEALEQIEELIPQHLREAFDALRDPTGEGPDEGFFMTSVLVDDVPHWGICAFKSVEGIGSTVIPLFMAIPAGHSVRLAVDPDTEAVHITEEEWEAVAQENPH